MPSLTIMWVSWFSLAEGELSVIFTPTVSEIFQNRLHYYFRPSCSSENAPARPVELRYTGPAEGGIQHGERIPRPASAGL